MEIADLKSFLAVVRHGSLQQAAGELHQTPSALSKALRRLEGSLGGPLFDRVGKTLRLNDAGERLRGRASELVQLVADTQAEFRGGDVELRCRVAAPAVLQWRYGPLLAERLAARYPGAGLAFDTQYEQESLLAVARGDVDFALVTRVAVEAGMPARLAALPLGQITMQLACAPGHALARGAADASGAVPVSTAAVLEHDFACPSRSLFCGIARGTRADGWRDDRLPRRIRYWMDDLQVLIALVRAGRALAYLPDFALAEQGLARLTVSDCPYACVEETLLVWQPAAAHGWHRYLVDALQSAIGLTPQEGS